jgi:type I restriction enzyme S subunit
MTDGWRTATIGDLVAMVDERLGTRPEPTILTLTEGGGFVSQAVRYKKRIAAEDTSNYRVIRKYDIAYNPYLLWKGAIAQHLADEDGITSPIYPVFRPRADTDARFVGLLLTGERMVRLYDSISLGSIERRRRAVPAQFVNLTVRIPSVPEQRRIADLISSLDDATLAARRHLEAAVKARREAVLRVLPWESENPVPLMSVLERVIGGAWGDPVGIREANADALSLHVFNNPLLTVDPRHSTPRSFSKDRLASRSLVVDDVLLERSGGTNDQPVGRVVYVDRSLRPTVPTDFMRLLRPDPNVAEPRFVFWWMWARYQRGDTTAYQSKTTNIRNLQVRDYLALPISIPDKQVQERVVALGAAFTALVGASQQVVNRLEALRTALFRELLDGVRALPASYDRFLDGAA